MCAISIERFIIHMGHLVRWRVRHESQTICRPTNIAKSTNEKFT